MIDYTNNRKYAFSNYFKYLKQFLSKQFLSKQFLNKACLLYLISTVFLISCSGGSSASESVEPITSQSPSLSLPDALTESLLSSASTALLDIDSSDSDDSIEIVNISVDPNPIITIGDYPSNFSKSTSILITASTFYFGQSTLNIKLRYSDGTTTISLPVENKISDISNIDVNYSFSPIKNLTASYTTIPYASGYELYQESTLGAGFAKVAQTSTANQLNIAISIPSSYHQIANDYPRYYTQVLREYNHNGVSKTAIQTPIFNLSNPSSVNDAIGYIKASNTDAGDWFGRSISLSADGNTLAVGARYEASNATGIDGDQNNDGASESGAAYIFTRSAGSWEQQAYIKASNTDAGDSFGQTVSLSADGNTLAVGAIWENSDATGINGDQNNDGASESGAAYIFTRSAGSWEQQAYIKASNTGGSDSFGQTVSLSADGNTLAVGAIWEDSDATGINGDQTNGDAKRSGAVYIFTRSAGSWSQQAYIKASNAYEKDYFGTTVFLSADGNTLAVGATGEDSSATGIDGDQTNDYAEDSGAAYIFTRSADNSWTQQAYIKASNTGDKDYFGTTVFLSADGNTLAVGASWEDSNAKGINGDQNNDRGAENSGAAYIFTRSAGSWEQQAYIKASNTGGSDRFGQTVSLSADGNTLAVGAWGEDSNATGIDGDQTNDDADYSGAAYVFYPLGR